MGPEMNRVSASDYERCPITGGLKKNVLSGKERSPGRRFGGRLQEMFVIG